MGSRKAVAIDGPAGAGKSTVGKGLARRLGWRYVDTGAMYRAATLKAVRAGADLSDAERIARIADEADIDLREVEGMLQVWLDGEDVTDQIRRPELTKQVRHVAGCPLARKALVRKQQECADRGPVVMEGRDIGTVVLPDAAVKFYLDASLEERARRRAGDLRHSGVGDVDLAAVRRDISARDRSDIERAGSPLTKAEDAEMVDTDGLSIDEVIDLLERSARRRLAQVR